MDFNNWKQRCSSLGHIMTNLEKLTPAQRQKLSELNERKELSKTDNKKGLTANLEKELLKLTKKLNQKDTLSSGIKTHLDDIFRSAYWKRRRVLESKYLSKGNFCEEDSLELISRTRGKFLIKNKTRFSNAYLEGEPDVNDERIHDAKSCWDMDTFDKAELTTLYKWQIKGYCILTGKKQGQLDYCLVNSPEHLITAEKNRVYYAMGSPDPDNDNYLENVRQIERNMIFDIQKFKNENPYYDFENKVLDFDVPEVLRIKSFEVKLELADKKNVSRRVKMCRTYLNNKCKEIESKLKD